MAGEDFDNHWNLLKWAVETLLTLKPGEYPPISYEQTYSAVYKCVCQGQAEELYKRLMLELENQLQGFRYHLQAVPDDQLIESFNMAWDHFSNGLSGIVPIFNYMARFYVEAKLNLNLRWELTKIFDNHVLQPILNRLLGRLRLAQNTPFIVCPSTMQNVVLAVHKLRPEIANELTDLFRRFIPELIQPVHLDQLPDLQDEARRMMEEARNSSKNHHNRGIYQNCPVAISGGDLHVSDVVAADACMDFQLLDERMMSGGSLVTDPVNVRREKRARSHDSCEDDFEGISVESGIQADPEEPSPSPRSQKQQIDTNNVRPRKHFHGENERE